MANEAIKSTGEPMPGSPDYVKEYMGLVQAQYPGLLEGLVNPCLETLSTMVEDIDRAVQEVKERYLGEGLEELDLELEPIDEVLNYVANAQTCQIPLPKGILMVTLRHGPEKAEGFLAVPVRVSGVSGN